MNIQQYYRPIELMKDSTMTQFEFKDFIGVWENFVPSSFCDNLIELFENSIITGEYTSLVNPNLRGKPETSINDGSDSYGSSLFRKDKSILLNYINESFSIEVNKFLTSCVSHYINNFPQLSELHLISPYIKFQKTSPGGGYHIWHYENSSLDIAARELVWTIYLNDLPDGEGETEFLYQHRRIKPSKGTVVVFPAGMTHVHRGNTVFTTDKYILTGWYIKNA